ncbi:MAG: sugar phosphate isomerase/epimerase family protein [Tepidisphaeraceae bacterium]
MKFAFSTVSCPAWDFETIVARAKEYGYDGVEVRGFLNESILTAANPFLTDPAKIRGLFDATGIEVCCLASSIAMTRDRKGDARLADNLRTYIDTAQKLGCSMVKIFDTQVKAGSLLMPWRGQSRQTTATALSEWLIPLADYAADRGVVIVVENALSFRNAKEMWNIIDRLNHPSVGVCWDLFNAAVIGEVPAYSVPTLNSRILYTQVKDAKLGPLGATYCKIGEGDVKVRDFLRRLRGVGYEGYITVEWEKAWLPNLAEPEEILPHSIAKLREWDQRLEISDWEAGAKPPEVKPPEQAVAATPSPV